jgi:GntR family transcriptional regulator, transcriptional repressor for pyruvate dehydrogenase complex
MKNSTATQDIYREMLANIQNGRWAAGAAIPSERILIGQYGVSRIAIREALSMLRGIGVLDVQHGRRTRVREVNSETFGRLLPLLLATGAQQTLEQVFDVRLAIESRTAYLAAGRPLDGHASKIERLAERFERLGESNNSQAVKVDLEFHLEIARMTGNPLYPILLEALADFIAFTQKESCQGSPLRRRRAAAAHAEIARAIVAREPEAARAAMEDHLRYSLSRRIAAAGSRSFGSALWHA